MTEAGIDETTVVLEVGAGNGFFTEVLAPTAAKVYAVELQEAMARKLYRRMRSVRSRSQLEIRVGDIARVELPHGMAQVAFIYYAFHEISSPEDAAHAIAKALAPEGRIYIVEPRIEVSEKAFSRSLEIFSMFGFFPERTWTTAFSRGALLSEKPAPSP